jgi:uncharacterized membrane protein HdeD (DUF308 family)
MFLRDPLQTLLVVGLMLGAWLLVSGIVDTTSALFGRSVNRVWGAITGLVELVLGCILVVNPSLSLTMLVVLSVLWMLAVGTIAIIGGFALRAQRAPAMVAEPPAPPA